MLIAKTQPFKLPALPILAPVQQQDHFPRCFPHHKDDKCKIQLYQKPKSSLFKRITQPCQWEPRTEGAEGLHRDLFTSQCFKAATDLEEGKEQPASGKSPRSASCSTGLRAGLQRPGLALPRREHALPSQQERHNDRKPTCGKQQRSALLPHREPRASTGARPHHKRPMTKLCSHGAEEQEEGRQ